MNVSPKRQMTQGPVCPQQGAFHGGLLSVLCAKGFLDLEEVKEKFSKFGSSYIGHPNNKLPGIEMNSDSSDTAFPYAWEWLWQER